MIKIKLENGIEVEVQTIAEAVELLKHSSEITSITKVYPDTITVTSTERKSLRKRNSRNCIVCSKHLPKYKHKYCSKECKNEMRKARYFKKGGRERRIRRYHRVEKPARQAERKEEIKSFFFNPRQD